MEKIGSISRGISFNIEMKKVQVCDRCGGWEGTSILKESFSRTKFRNRELKFTNRNLKFLLCFLTYD